MRNKGQRRGHDIISSKFCVTAGITRGSGVQTVGRGECGEIVAQSAFAEKVSQQFIVHVHSCSWEVVWRSFSLGNDRQLSLLSDREGDSSSYRFDMPALVTNLKQMKEKQNSPYCNIPILKYEVRCNCTDSPKRLPFLCAVSR